MELNEILERMHSGKLYYCHNQQLVDVQLKAMDLVWEYNQTRPSQLQERQRLLKQMLADVGQDCMVNNF